MQEKPVKALDGSGLSVSKVTGKTQSLMCFRNKHGEILIETPNKKVLKNVFYTQKHFK